MTSSARSRPIRALMELRPAFGGHAGIPQETRLLFRGLLQLPELALSGLLQSSEQYLPAGTPAPGSPAFERLGNEARIHRLARVVIAAQPAQTLSRLLRLVALARVGGATLASWAGALVGQRQPLDHFDPTHFRDFIWRGLFAKTLPAEDFEAITAAHYRIARLPWSWAHLSGMLAPGVGGRLYPRLDTRDFDLFIGETPYPGRIAAGTRMVIRYHDAIPLLMPHTISDRHHHHAAHAAALRQNVADGAWFACVSEATRRDLLSVYPQLEARSVVIPNMVSHHYHAEPVDGARVLGILQNRQSSAFPRHAAAVGGPVLRPGSPLGSAPFDYLLMVSTIEPRKNHLSLLAAWEQLRCTSHPDLQLVVVGGLGWEHRAITQRLKPWVGRGLHVLEDVPASELRVLYQHARVTVCPSFGEGFDYSGVEAMQSGGIVAASDIPVHREVYENAAVYFSPYSVRQQVNALESLLSKGSAGVCDALRTHGIAVSARYVPSELLPVWQALISRLAREP